MCLVRGGATSFGPWMKLWATSGNYEGIPLESYQKFEGVSGMVESLYDFEDYEAVLVSGGLKETKQLEAEYRPAMGRNSVRVLGVPRPITSAWDDTSLYAGLNEIMDEINESMRELPYVQPGARSRKSGLAE